MNLVGIFSKLSDDDTNTIVHAWRVHNKRKVVMAEVPFLDIVATVQYLSLEEAILPNSKFAVSLRKRKLKLRELINKIEKHRNKTAWFEGGLLHLR